MTSVKSKRKPKQGHLTESHKLLQLVSLSIIIKCDRCKDTIDVPNVKDTRKRDGAGTRSETCKKCANSLGISNGLRPVWVIRC